MQRLLHDLSLHPVCTILFCLGILLALSVVLLVLSAALLGVAALLDRLRKK